MKKWLDKYEAPKAQNGIEGTMGGLTDVGFNYNGAWGGQFAMGGNLPGTTGMMYARIGAPSNGPYAKKTKASAQNGMEMKYYQEGLDFKPKTISQDGTRVVIPKRDLRTLAEAEAERRLANQPVIQSPKGRQLTKEEINQKNKKYAQQTGKKYNEKSGAVEDRFTPSQERVMNRAVENIIEPMTIIEGGMAAAPLIKQGLKGARKHIANKISLNNSEKNSISYTLSQLAANLNPKNLKTESATDYLKSWYSDPDFIRRYTPTGKYHAGAMQNHILESLDNYEPKNYIDLLKDKGLSKYAEKSILTGGVSWGTPKEIYVNRSTYAPFNKKGLESVRAHELTHLAEVNGDMLSSFDEAALLSPFEVDNDLIVPKSSFFKKLMGDDSRYYLDPTEIHARMNQARFDLGLSPKDKFTEKMFNEISKKKKWYGMGRYIKNKEKFIDLMNNFWAVPPAVVGGAAAIDKKEDGGEIVKDDMGYWNPDNWGKPVEIGSNVITMEGVDVPLIGISDTGDVQYMEPGEEEYVFDGETVTEYPVARNGINQADAQPIKKLDQSLNFTNYNKPTKGGWLNKYK